MDLLSFECYKFPDVIETYQIAKGKYGRLPHCSQSQCRTWLALIRERTSGDYYAEIFSDLSYTARAQRSGAPIPDQACQARLFFLLKEATSNIPNMKLQGIKQYNRPLESQRLTSQTVCI